MFLHLFVVLLVVTSFVILLSDKIDFKIIQGAIMSKTKKIAIVRKLLFYIFCFLVMYITLFSRKSPTGQNMLMHPFWEYIAFLRNMCWATAHDIVLNILLFVPYGFLFPTAFHKKKKYTVVAGFVFTLFIETSQLLFKLGWAEVDDIFNNTLGAFIGFIIYQRIERKVVE